MPVQPSPTGASGPRPASPRDVDALRASLATMAETFERLCDLFDFGTGILFGAAGGCLAAVLIAASVDIHLGAWDFAPIVLAPVFLACASYLAFVAARCDRAALRVLRHRRWEGRDGGR